MPGTHILNHVFTISSYFFGIQWNRSEQQQHVGEAQQNVSPTLGSTQHFSSGAPPTFFCKTCTFLRKIDKEITCWQSYWCHTGNIHRSFNNSGVSFKTKPLTSMYVQRIPSFKDLIVKHLKDFVVLQQIQYFFYNTFWRKRPTEERLLCLLIDSFIYAFGNVDLTLNIFILMGIIKQRLYVERQGWLKQRCNRSSRGRLCELQLRVTQVVCFWTH